MKIHPEEPETLVLHQSDIKHFINCPDQFRAANGILPGGDLDPDVDHRVETDAATLGTVFHKVIETDIADPFTSLSAIERFAKKMLGDTIMEYTMDGVEYRTESFGDAPDKQLLILARMVRAWYKSQERGYWVELYKDHPGHVVLEWNFTVPFLKRSGKYKEVHLSGTADVLDTYSNRLVDWKTASRDYQRWEKQRWDPQPTVYTYAAAELGLLERGSEGYEFQYKVFSTKRDDDEPNTVTVYRDQGSHGWLVQQVSHMVDLIESDLERWPLRDDHALCSPKWCPIWDQCKGMYVSHPEWR